MSIYSRRKKAAAVNSAYREVQTKMRKEVAKLQKIKTPFDNIKYGVASERNTSVQKKADVGLKRMEDIGMKGRAARTKAISVAAKKHGVPKSQIVAKKPINPGVVARKMARQLKSKYSLREIR
tara:strand:- start:9539 stop:9907 length:369 start_codon:yes stop_codon:yes gene_type:complete